MRPTGIVVETPGFNDSTNLRQPSEHMLIEEFVPERR